MQSKNLNCLAIGQGTPLQNRI